MSSLNQGNQGNQVNKVNQVMSNYQPPVTNFATSQYGYKKINEDNQLAQSYGQTYKQAPTIAIPKTTIPQVTSKGASISPISHLP